MTNVALIFGGQSPEHEVSIVSARNVRDKLTAAGFQVTPVGIDLNGRWHVGGDAFAILSEGPGASAETGPPDLSAFRAAAPDVAFPIIHGGAGEDGSLQGLLEMMGVPYVGGDVLCQSLCLDKISARQVLLANGLPQIPYTMVYRRQFEAHEASTLEGIETKLRYPLFVKPSRAGSSIGISKVSDKDALRKALDNAFRFDFRVIVENGVEAQEVEVAGLGGYQDPMISKPGRIIPENDFYDFEEKYIKGTTKFEIPVELPEDQLTLLRSYAKTAWSALNCHGLARIDFLITKEAVYLNEINTVPGFTSISMYPKLMEVSGVDQLELMRRLIGLALSRVAEEQRVKVFQSNSDWFKKEPQ